MFYFFIYGEKVPFTTFKLWWEISCAKFLRIDIVIFEHAGASKLSRWRRHNYFPQTVESSTANDDAAFCRPMCLTSCHLGMRDGLCGDFIHLAHRSLEVRIMSESSFHKCRIPDRILIYLNFKEIRTTKYVFLVRTGMPEENCRHLRSENWKWKKLNLNSKVVLAKKFKSECRAVDVRSQIDLTSDASS